MNISERVISGVFGRCRLVFYEKILRVCLFLVLDIKVVDHGLFFDHLRPGASTGSPEERIQKNMRPDNSM